jgi:Amt family ammonium transporter
MTGYWIMGFALHMGGLGTLATLGGTGVLDSEFTISLFGKDFGLFGMKGFFLAGSTYDVAVFTLFLFQMVFMDTAATIPTGAMAERWKFSAFVVYGFFISMISYPIFANWVWGGGWLSQLGKNFGLGHGHVDFAGSSVVHMVGGVTALAGAMVLGARIGKYNKDGTPNPIPGHNIPMAALGCFILAFGWFGFNPGSTMAADAGLISTIALNTNMAAAAGCLAAAAVAWTKLGKPDLSMILNGTLAGLVAITAGCNVVSTAGSVAIGALAGVLVVFAVLFFDRVKLDDPVGALSVHLVNGVFGTLAVGLFATDGGLFYGGGAALALTQLKGVLAVGGFTAAASALLWYALKVSVGIRVTPDEEREGLDAGEHGMEAYPGLMPQRASMNVAAANM